MNRLRQALAQRNGKTLLGAACYFYDPIFLEIAAHVGFDAIWIEMEHAAISFAEAGDLCRMASGHRHAHHDPGARYAARQHLEER